MTPYIIVLGKIGTDNFIAGESSTIIESKSFKDSLLDLIVVYFVYDIVYPKSLAPFFIFFQHFVFELKDGQQVPLPTSKLVSNLNKMSII